MILLFAFITVALLPLAFLRWKRGQRAVPILYLFGSALNLFLFVQELLKRGHV